MTRGWPDKDFGATDYLGIIRQEANDSVYFKTSLNISNHPISQHRIRHLDKAGYIGAFNVVHMLPILPMLHALAMDTHHDLLQP